MKRGTERNEEEVEMLYTDLDAATKEAESNALSLPMRKAADNLKLSLDLDGVDSTEEGIEKEDQVDPYMDNNKGEAYNTTKESGGEDSAMDMSKDCDINVIKVSSGEFKVAFSKKYKDPKDFKQELRSKAGSLLESMILCINLLRKELKDAQDELPFNLTTYGRLYTLLAEESGRAYRDNLQYQDSIKEDIAALAGIDDQDDPLLEMRSLNNNSGQAGANALICDWATKVVCSWRGQAPVHCQHNSCKKPTTTCAR